MIFMYCYIMCGEYRESKANPLMHVKRKANKPTLLNLCKKTLLGMAMAVDIIGGTGVESHIFYKVLATKNA